MKSTLLASLIVVTLGAAGGAVWAQSEGESEMRGHGDRHQQQRGRYTPDPERLVERMTRRLDLDAVQQQNIGNHLTAVQPEFEALSERAQGNREALRALDTASADYAAQLDSLAVERGQIATERTMLLGRLRAQVANELTDEQRAEAEALFEQRRGRFERRWRQRD